MKKYLYKGPKFVKSLLTTNYERFRIQDQYFAAAMLAHMYNNPNQHPYKAFQTHHLLTTKQHFNISQSDHIQQLYFLLNSMHKIIQNQQVIFDKRVLKNMQTRYLNIIRQIYDPNSFPIYSTTQEVVRDLDSLWNYKKDYMENLVLKVGYWFQIKKSTVTHMDSGKGLFLRTNNQKISPGKLLALFPGIIYKNPSLNKINQLLLLKGQLLDGIQKVVLDYKQKIPYPFYYDRNLDDFEEYQKISIENSQINLVKGEWINPYFLGHYVNHQDINQMANATVIKLSIPKNFFTQQLLRFVPCIDKSDNSTKNYDIFGVLSIRQIKDGDEILVNYLQNHIFHVQDIPQWYQANIPKPVYLTKLFYQSDQGQLEKYFEYLFAQKGIKSQRIIKYSMQN